MAPRALFVVNVAGQNITARILPLLISLRISDKEGTHSDTVEIVLDDNGGQIKLPRDGDPITVLLGWEGGALSLAFEGTVDEVRSSGSRGSGRELRISGKGVDTKGKAKEGQQMSMDDMTVQDALNKAGQKAGISVKVDPSLANIKRAWWGLNDESFIHFGERVAREMGGIFKIKGKQAILAKKGGGSVSGGALGSVPAVWGLNLISWDIAPTLGRPRHKQTRSRYYDTKKAEWKSVTEETDDTGADATLADRHTRTDEEEAKGAAENGARDSEREKGGGTVSIDGTIAAKPGGTCLVGRVRPGVNGAYRITTVDHELNRSGGWLTNLEVKQPQGSAGTDSR